MRSEHQKEVMQAKIDARYYSRELIRDVFQATEHFPKNDPEFLAPQLRKKVLTVSSFLAHGTVKNDIEEQKEALVVVMHELREILKFITIAHHLRYASDLEKHKVRTGIINVITALDKLSLLLGGFEEK
ncbi:MAG: four helix bundle protein [Crocinitomicaceae bacterium]|nr:four helix bundle protein [Crocinitomicaceae bacterium]